MNIQCCICHEKVRVPVRFICFPCKNENGPSCNSITRVCLKCACGYLQLDKKRSERTFYRKCLTCPAVVKCSNLSAINSYEKDFFTMSLDLKKDYPCFYDNDGCRFLGTQNELDHHIQTKCLFRVVSCIYCQTYYQAKDEDNHVLECKERFRCSFCLEHIPLQEETEHFLKKHEQKKCPYCRHYIPIVSFEQHLIECPERPCECPSCRKKIRKHEMHDHLVEHIVSCEKRIRNYTNSINILSTQILLFINECKKYR